jgi:hypothetical protein
MQKNVFNTLLPREIVYSGDSWVRMALGLEWLDYVVCSFLFQTWLSLDLLSVVHYSLRISTFILPLHFS